MYIIREVKIRKEKEEWKKKTGQGSPNSRFGALQSSESKVSKGDRSLMNQFKVPRNVNNIICEAVNCFSSAEVQIEVKVGQAGSISLSLCNDCVCKFRDEQQ
jgi:hypothetical protein